jgi:hypothetical protein
MLQFGTLSDELTAEYGDVRLRGDAASAVSWHTDCQQDERSQKENREDQMRLALVARGERRVGAGPAPLAAAPGRALSRGWRD